MPPIRRISTQCRCAAPNTRLEICPDVQGLRFRYFDQKNDDEPGEWLERWDPVEMQGMMPKIIEVTLTFLDQRGEETTQQLIIPIMSSLQK